MHVVWCYSGDEGDQGDVALFPAVNSAFKGPMAQPSKASPLTDYERYDDLTCACRHNLEQRCEVRKRRSFAAIESAIQYFKEALGVGFERIPISKLKCGHSPRNKQCSYLDCEYYENGKAIITE